MADGAKSDDAAVQRQLDRLTLRSPGADVLGLDRITRLMDRLGNPHRQLPPVFHVAGTNGKGSTCAYLRAGIEAAGLKAHVYTSPHLVRFNERIRLAGTLISDEQLAAILEEVLDIGEDITASFFEITTAAAFLLFSRVPADACVIEVGVGGRLDATNILAHPVACGITQLGIDHIAFLGDTIEGIAYEKASIAKPGVPLLTFHYPASVAERIGQTAHDAGASWYAKGDEWDATIAQGRLHYRDARGELHLPLPRLPGAHQAANAGLAIAMMRHQSTVAIPDAALRAAMGWADWPARLQPIGPGPLLARLPEGSELWLDGVHNSAGARAIADHFRHHVPAGRPFHVVLGLLGNRDPSGVLQAFAQRAGSLIAVPVPGHEHHAPDELAAGAESLGVASGTAADPIAALDRIAAESDPANPPVVLIGGSLYLAGPALLFNGTPPT